MSSNPDKPKEEAYSGIKITDEDRDIGSVRVTKRLADHDLWEAQQLIASGVLSVEDYPTYDEEHGVQHPEPDPLDLDTRPETRRLEERGRGLHRACCVQGDSWPYARGRGIG